MSWVESEEGQADLREHGVDAEAIRRESYAHETAYVALAVDLAERFARTAAALRHAQREAV
jgi:hypothetical protein